MAQETDPIKRAERSKLTDQIRTRVIRIRTCRANIEWAEKVAEDAKATIDREKIVEAAETSQLFEDAKRLGIAGKNPSVNATAFMDLLSLHGAPAPSMPVAPLTPSWGGKV